MNRSSTLCEPSAAAAARFDSEKATFPASFRPAYAHLRDEEDHVEPEAEEGEQMAQEREELQPLAARSFDLPRLQLVRHACDEERTHTAPILRPRRIGLPAVAAAAAVVRSKLAPKGVVRSARPI